MVLWALVEIPTRCFATPVLRCPFTDFPLSWPGIFNSNRGKARLQELWQVGSSLNLKTVDWVPVRVPALSGLGS